MTITMNLEPEKEAWLLEQAARAGRKTDEYVQDLVLRGLPEPEKLVVDASASPRQTLAEALVGHIGTQHSGRGDLSQNTGKAFAKLMVEKRKAGRL